MGYSDETESGLDLAAQTLFNLSIERDDIKSVAAAVPDDAKVKPSTLEYELQILKIISVGWGISLYLAQAPYKEELSGCYWRRIHRLSADISANTEKMTGMTVDYFKILKERLDIYLAAMNVNSQAAEPAAVIGPEFARLCGHPDDTFAIMAGSRIFITTIAHVQRYLQSITPDGTVH